MLDVSQNSTILLTDPFTIDRPLHDHHCERLLVQQAFSVHRAGKMLAPIIDDAHLMPADCLRKLRLLCEDFPRSHNLILIGQPPLLQSLSLSINEEIRSRVTYSALLSRLAPDTVEQFILDQLDRAGLGHNTFTPEALALIVRSGEGLLRRTRNLCLSSPRSQVHQTRVVDLKQVNRVLIQPHWRKTVTSPSLKGSRWSRERIRAARSAPLGKPLLQKRGRQLIQREAGNFILPAYPGLIVKDSYWRWPERNLAGNAIDFHVQVLGLSFHDAMRQITGT
ncbi:MAG: hypothetical protein KIS67_21015 [Verrucomicrobiae bacterium]|nr:hypothetical protein [Verrucomicrobiae bacterium]